MAVVSLALNPNVRDYFGADLEFTMSFPRGRGRLVTEQGRVAIVARCPLCGGEHRYDKGPVGAEEIEEIRSLGFSDEWLPCQMDLPGNFWRVVITSGGKGNRSGGRRPKTTRPG
jgi:hypothetical protein